jgi:hypothetical protein
MFKHVAEAFIAVRYAETVAQKVCIRSADYCRSIAGAPADKLLDFGDARAILRPTDDGLHVLVEARDLIAFYAVETLLRGSVTEIAPLQDATLEWHQAVGIPFCRMQAPCANGSAKPGGK